MIILAVVLVIFLILWAVPILRRGKAEAWRVALKSVPLGCFTMLAVPILLVNTGFAVKFVSHMRVLSLAFGGMGVVAGIAVIVGMVKFLKKRHGITESRGIWKRCAITFLALATGFAAFTYFAVILPFSKMFSSEAVENFKGEWRAYDLPAEGDVRIVFEEKPIHPFLAEYDYRLRFEKDGETILRNLMTNTGGRTHFNIYRLKDGRLWFTDRYGDYIVNPQSTEIFWLGNTGVNAVCYDGGESLPVTFIDEVLLREAEYYGTIRYDGFYYAADKEYEAIDNHYYEKMGRPMPESLVRDKYSVKKVE